MAAEEHVEGDGLKQPQTGAKMPLFPDVSPLPVLSAAGTEDKELAAPLNRDELSLYTAPEPNANFLQPEPGPVEESVAAARRWLLPCVSWCRVTFDRLEAGGRRGVRAGRDAYAFLSDPPPHFYPRAAVVGFTGVLGAFAAGGARLKRWAYPAALMAVTASMYYPESAAGAARAAGGGVYAGAAQGYAAAQRLLGHGAATRQDDGEHKP